ncbi:hypothetical protein JQ578_50960 [Bradyrhizobium liaoningense]|nr:hypothetical protein [Bradyrhizobium liaoningense]
MLDGVELQSLRPHQPVNKPVAGAIDRLDLHGMGFVFDRMRDMNIATL